MHKFVSFLLLLVFTLNTGIALADDKPVPITKGTPAPFSGLLLTPAAVAKIIVDLEARKKEVDIAVTAAKAEQKANDDKNAADQGAICDRDKKILQSNLDYEKKLSTELTTALKKSEDSRSNPMVYLVLGAIGGAVVMLAGAFAITYAAK